MAGKVMELLYSIFRGGTATMYSNLVEETARRREYVAHQQQSGHPRLTVLDSSSVLTTPGWQLVLMVE